MSSSLNHLRFIATLEQSQKMSKPGPLAMSGITPSDTIARGLKMTVEDQASVFIDDPECILLSSYQSKGLAKVNTTSISKYIKLFGETNLDWGLELPEITDSVKSAIMLTIFRIKEVECIRMLSFLSYMNCNEIVEPVWKRFEQNASLQNSDSRSGTKSVLSLLIESGLVRRYTRGHSISIEPAVQRLMRTILESGFLSNVLNENERKPEYWIDVAMEMVCSTYPSNPHETVLESEALCRIAHSCLRLAEEYCVKTPRAATLHRRIADSLSFRGSYEQAYHAYQRAIHITECLYGMYDPKIVGILINLGTSYAKYGRCEDAVNVFDRSLRIMQMNKNLPHDTVGEIYMNLGSVYSEMGRYRDSVSQYEGAITIRGTSQCIDFAKLAEAHAGLGDAHLRVGHFETASGSYERALEVYKNVPSKNHVFVLRVRERLGQAYSGLGKHSASLKIYESVLTIKKDIFGEEHAKVADTIHNMGVVLKDLGDFHKAIDCFEKAQDMYEKKGIHPNDVRISNAVKNVGVVYTQQGNHQKAIEYFQKALQLEKQSGRNELGMASSLNNIGVAYARLGSYHQALTLYQEALGILTRIRGPSHVETGDMIYNLGMTQISLGNARLAKIHLEQSRRIFISALGKRHPKCTKVSKLLKWQARQRHTRRDLHAAESRAPVDLSEGLDLTELLASCVGKTMKSGQGL